MADHGETATQNSPLMDAAVAGEKINLSGRVTKLLFQKKETGFVIVDVATEVGERVRVAGVFKGKSLPVEGDVLDIKGAWEKHDTFGLRVKARSMTMPLPDTNAGIMRWLRAYKNDGLDEHSVHQFAERHRANLSEALSKKEALEACGVDGKLAKKISFAWTAANERVQLKELFEGHRVFNDQVVSRIISKYGAEATGIVRTDPWRLALDIPGVGIASADNLAEALGLGKESLSRSMAAVMDLVFAEANNGHVAVPERLLAKKAAQNHQMSPDVVNAAIEALTNEERLISDTITGVRCLYLRKSYHHERLAAAVIATKVMSRPSIVPSVVDAQVAKRKETGGKTLSAEQTSAIRGAFASRFSVIRGWPGTGKTTCINTVVAVAGSLGMKVLLAAPTAKAAKRMTEVTGVEATTAHRLLGMKSGKWTHNASNKLSGQLLVIDEGSMADIHVTASLLAAVPDDMHVVFVGDEFQLKSVGQGRVFEDIIRSGVVPTTTLSRIYRSEGSAADGSDGIYDATYMIRNGRIPENDMGNYKQVVDPDPAKLLRYMDRMLTDRLPSRGYSLDDTVICAPMHKGVLGVSALNKRLSSLLNPKDLMTNTFTTKAGHVFGPGERVLQVENEYERGGVGVVNGDTGVVLDYDATTREVLVRFDGIATDIVYSQADFARNTIPAWAMTIHKMQGSETPVILNFIHSEASFMLESSLFSTGVSRARELSITLGDTEGLAKGVKSMATDYRMSGLAKHIHLEREALLNVRLSPAHTNNL